MRNTFTTYFNYFFYFFTPKEKGWVLCYVKN